MSDARSKRIQKEIRGGFIRVPLMMTSGRGVLADPRLGSMGMLTTRLCKGQDESDHH
jgi:hypothetical protein